MGWQVYIKSDIKTVLFVLHVHILPEKKIITKVIVIILKLFCNNDITSF